MGNFRKVLAMSLVFLLAFAPLSYGAIEVKDDGTTVGIINSIDFEGATVTQSGTVATVVLDDINSGTIDGAVIGGTTPAAGTFTTLEAEDSLTVNGETITSFGGVVSPWTASATTTTVNAAPAKFVATHATGVFAATGLTAGPADVVLENAQIIDGGTNGAINLTEAGDTASISFSGDDIVLDTTDGGYIFTLTDATNGTVDIMANNDADDYIQFTTAAHVPTIVTQGTCDLAIIPDGGDVALTGNLAVSGTLTTGVFAADSMLFTDDTLTRTVDDVLRWESNDEKTTILSYGFEAKSAALAMHADEGDNAGDSWELTVADGGTLAISNDSAVDDTQANIAVFANSGDLTMEGDVITLGDDEYISNATDGTVLVATNDESIILLVKSNNAGNGTADLVLAGDAIGDVGDQWRFRAGGVAEDLLIGNDSAISGTFVDKMVISATTGNVDITGDLDITGGDITVPADLTITPAGADVLVDGGLTVGSTTQAGDNNLRVEGTSALVGNTTITGDLTVTGADIQLGAATGVKLTSDDDGMITFLGTGAGSDEDMSINLDDTSNEITIATTTGATLFNLDGALDLKVSGLGLQLGDAGVLITADTDGSVGIAGLGNGSDEDLVFDFDNTADTVEISTTTGVATILGTDIGITMTEGTDVSKPLLWMENTKDDATAPIIRLENDRTTETAGDDLGIIYFRGSDNADAATDFITLLGEANEVVAGNEAGKYSVSVKLDDASTEFIKFFGDTGGSATGHVEINSTSVDIDTHMDTADQADIFLLDGATNDLTLTRNLAAAASTDGPILVVTNTSATGDVGVASFLNAAGASATAPTVTIQSSAAGVVKSSLFVNHDGTAGATTESAVMIDSDDVNTAALYITSPNTAAGTTSQIDDYIVAVVAEGVGGGASLYRNVSAATEALLNVREVHADSTAPLVNINTAADGSADDAVVTIQASNAAHDTSLLAVVNAGVGRSAFIDSNVTTATTLVPSMEIDSQATNGAALIVRAPTTLTGTDGDFDDFVMGISAEGVGGGLHVHRNIDNPTGPLLKLTEDNVMTTSSIPLLDIESDADASASTTVVKIATTSTANDQALMLLTQAGVTSTNFAKMITFNTFTLWVSDGTTAEGALTGVEGDICLNGGTGAGQTAFCDSSGTNWTDM